MFFLLQVFTDVQKLFPSHPELGPDEIQPELPQARLGYPDKVDRLLSAAFP